jgi:hypothetical protein
MSGWVKLEDRLPVTAGEYNVIVEGWHTMLPLFVTFDGTQWLDQDYRKHYNGANIYWHPKQGE